MRQLRSEAPTLRTLALPAGFGGGPQTRAGGVFSRCFFLVGEAKHSDYILLFSHSLACSVGVRRARGVQCDLAPGGGGGVRA